MAWDILDEDCSDISDWVDADSGGTSEVSPAGQFRFYSPSTGNYAMRARDINNEYLTFTYEMRIKFDVLNTYGLGRATLDVFMKQWMISYYGFYVLFSSNRLVVQDDIITTTVPTGSWHVWSFQVTDRGGPDIAVEVFLDGVSLGTGDTDSTVGYSDTHITLYAYTPAQTMHIDYIKAGQGHIKWTPTYQDIGIRFYDGTDVKKIGVETLNGHKLRISKGGTTYGVPLLATDDPDASPVRVYDGSDVKSLPFRLP